MGLDTGARSLGAVMSRTELLLGVGGCRSWRCGGHAPDALAPSVPQAAGEGKTTPASANNSRTTQSGAPRIQAGENARMRALREARAVPNNYSVHGRMLPNNRANLHVSCSAESGYDSETQTLVSELC